MLDRGTSNGAPSATTARGVPFTEFDTRQLGPVRRYFLRHPVVMDWFIVALYVLPGLLGVRGGVTVDWPLLVTTLLTGSALLYRRRWPLPVAGVVTACAVAMIVLTGYSGNSEFAFAFACYAVAVACPPLVSWLITGTMMLIYASVVMWWKYTINAAPILIYQADQPILESDAAVEKLMTIVSALLFAVIGLAIGASVRSRRLHVADLIERTNVLARERDQEGQIAVAGERTRIAREMHDVIAHSLTVMVTLADGAKATPDRALATQALGELAATGRGALMDMRRVLGVLRDNDDVLLAPHGRSESLEEIVEPFRTAGLSIRIVRSGGMIALPANLRHAAHRIVTEALTNVLRYAPLAPVTEVRVHQRQENDGTWLDIRVSNSAGPVDSPAKTPAGSGHGIIGMKERAAMFGGRATAGPTATGWEVTASLHILDEDDSSATTPESRPW